MRMWVAAGAVMALSCGAWGCTGSSKYSSGGGGTPIAPTPVTPGNAITIDVVAINGAQSFSPNPAGVLARQMVVWHNVDSVPHHVVFDDGSVDTGELAPGASSQPMTINAAGGPYHCSIHPVMIGSVNQELPSQPQPCEGPYCG
jgi:plastocyanin